MKSRDQLLLEEAYTKVATRNEIIDEGVWSQIKGLGKGLASGAVTGLQNVAAGAAKAVGVKVDDTNKQTMGQAYAKAQQGSMLKGFQTSAEKTINDFINDAKKMGVDLNDPNVAKLFPEAATTFQNVQNLLKYVKNPAAAPTKTVTSATTPVKTAATPSGRKPLSNTPTNAKKRANRAVAKQTAPSTSPAVATPVNPARGVTVKTSTGTKTKY